MEGQKTQENQILHKYKAHLSALVFTFIPFISLLFTPQSPYFLYVALFLGCGGSAGLFFFLQKREKKMQRSVSAIVKAKLKQYALDSEQKGQIFHEEIANKERLFQKTFDEAQRYYEHQLDLLKTSVLKSKEKVEEISFELCEKNSELDQFKRAIDEMRRDLYEEREKGDKLAHEWGATFQKKEVMLEEYRKTITEQRLVIEKKQKYIQKLETKVKDLMYEIRSLLLVDEPDDVLTLPQRDFISVESSKSDHSDAFSHLNRYLNAVQNFAGADHLASLNGHSPKYHLPYENFAIDQRRLFEIFREENSGIVFVYSLTDSKFLFTNHLVKTLLGWSAEKFTKDFSSLVANGYTEWRKALHQLAVVKESAAKLAIKSKYGDDVFFQCLMGLVSKGPFNNHVIGILTPLSV